MICKSDRVRFTLRHKDLRKGGHRIGTLEKITAAAKTIFRDTQTLIKRLIASWLTAIYANYAFFAPHGIFTKEYPLSVGVLLTAAVFLLSFAVMTLAALAVRYRYKTDSGWLLIISVMTALCLAFGEADIYACIALLPVIAAAVYFTLVQDGLKLPKALKKRWYIIICAGGAVMVFFACVTIAARYYQLYAPAYDFGIFSQMFENMKDGFFPLTTVERGYELSHFAVHFSPAYYIMLPFYMLFPHPVTLEVLQGIAVTVGVIPAFLIARKYGLSKTSCAAIGLIFCFYPAFIGGCRYDMHENCLLVPFLMWLFWAIERERYGYMAVFTLLTLTVKEDAAVYICVTALYLIFSDRGKKMKLAGGAMAAVGLLYFIAVCVYLESCGLGVMAWRYDNYSYNGGGLLTVITSVLIDPAYALGNSFASNKLLFILQMLAPLGFIPCVCRKFSRLLLLIPFVLINLMSGYVYQFDINFQYVFGSGAIMIWLFIMNCSDMKYKARRGTIAFCVIACAVIFGCCHRGLVSELPRVGDDTCRAVVSYLENFDSNGGSISADTFFVPALYRQKELYAITSSDAPDPHNSPAADIALLDKRFKNYEKLREYYLEQGMKEVSVDGNAGSVICRLEKQ